MSRQRRPLWIRTHSTIHRSIRLCTTPSFCKQPLVDGKAAGPKSIAGDTIASNNFSRMFLQLNIVYIANFFPSNHGPWANSKSLLARKLPLKFRPKYLCRDSSWIICTISPPTSTNSELSDGDVVKFFVCAEVGGKPQAASSRIKASNM